MGIRSLLVSVRLNDSTYLASSVSAHLQAVESAQMCAYTHTLTHVTLYLLLVFYYYYFHFYLHLLSYLSLRICDFLTHSQCVCVVFLSILYSVPLSMKKRCPSSQSATRIDALSLQIKRWRGADLMA